MSEPMLIERERITTIEVRQDKTVLGLIVVTEHNQRCGWLSYTSVLMRHGPHVGSTYHIAYERDIEKARDFIIRRSTTFNQPIPVE